MNPLSPERLARWLLQGPPRLPSGAYLSWVDTERTGFPYAEAAAVVVRTACWWAGGAGERSLLDRLVPTLAFLDRATHSDGLVWHNDTGYLFDSLLVLAAFHAARTADVPYDAAPPIARLTQGCARLCRHRTAAVDAATPRWSTRFGPFLLKAAGVACSHPDLDPELRGLLLDAARELVRMRSDAGAFAHPEDDVPYLHAHAYALEGLALLHATGALPLDGFDAGIAWLADQQRPDGTFPQHPRGNGAAAGDVAAQAGRLCLLAPHLWPAGAVDGIDRTLASLQGPEGGIRYLSTLDHQNTWTTAFALQYLRGREEGLQAVELV